MRSPLELIKRFCAASLVFVATRACNAQDIDLVSKPVNGASDLAIVRTKKDGTDFFFVDTKTNERLGDVLKDLNGARVQDIKASWSPDGRKVAVLISYGTRLNAILVYALGNGHKMKRVHLPDIDPVGIYHKHNPDKHFLRQAEQSGGYSENALGGWITNDSLRMVRGDALIGSKGDEDTKHFLIVLEVEIVGDRGRIVSESLSGVLSNEQAATFLSKWNSREGRGGTRNY
jgi:hypothetical protein